MQIDLNRAQPGLQLSNEYTQALVDSLGVAPDSISETGAQVLTFLLDGNHIRGGFTKEQDTYSPEQLQQAAQVLISDRNAINLYAAAQVLQAGLPSAQDDFNRALETRIETTQAKIDRFSDENPNTPKREIRLSTEEYDTIFSLLATDESLTKLLKSGVVRIGGYSAGTDPSADQIEAARGELPSLHPNHLIAAYEAREITNPSEFRVAFLASIESMQLDEQLDTSVQGLLGRLREFAHSNTGVAIQGAILGAGILGGFALVAVIIVAAIQALALIDYLMNRNPDAADNDRSPGIFDRVKNWLSQTFNWITGQARTLTHGVGSVPEQLDSIDTSSVVELAERLESGELQPGDTEQLAQIARGMELSKAFENGAVRALRGQEEEDRVARFTQILQTPLGDGQTAEQVLTTGISNFLQGQFLSELSENDSQIIIGQGGTRIANLGELAAIGDKLTRPLQIVSQRLLQRARTPEGQLLLDNGIRILRLYNPIYADGAELLREIIRKGADQAEAQAPQPVAAPNPA